ncbi:MAG: glycosyltransferase [Gemmatimonadaceae bacterium]
MSIHRVTPTAQRVVTGSPTVPRVSVVMAVHDGEQYVGAAVDSVLGQSFRNFELLVVDDGSADRSAEIVRERTDPRVRVLANDRNIGLARSLNRGLGEARGELVARLDADDLCVPDRLLRQVAFMDANPEIALAGSWYLEIDADGSVGPRRSLPVDHWDLRWQLLLSCPFVHSAVIWRRQKVADAVGHYDERLVYSMDYDLWRRISERLRVANLPEYLLHLRVHSASMTATYGARAREGVRLRAARVASLLGWPAADVEGNERRLVQLYNLLLGTPRDRTVREVVSDAGELIRLHDAFVASEIGLPVQEARRQSRMLRARLARRMLRASRDAPSDERGGASRMLLLAVADLAPRSLASREGLRACLALVRRRLIGP